MTPLCTKKEERICQGDIIRNVSCIERIIEDGKKGVAEFDLSHVIVLTQDCDLNQDFVNRNKVKSYIENGEIDKIQYDKYLVSVIVAPLYNYEIFKLGKHRPNLTTIPIDKRMDAAIVVNNSPRHHFFNFGKDNIYGMVDCVVDFKHYFSVNIEYLMSLKNENYVGKVVELHRENISQRFAAFLSRIGLPDPPAV